VQLKGEFDPEIPHLDTITAAATACLAVFTSSTDHAGRELFVTDGTPAGTGLLADLVPGSEGSYPSSLTPYQGQVYFTAYTKEHNGTGIWVTDGTRAGTRLAVSPSIFPKNSDFHYNSDRLIKFDGKLLFLVKPFLGKPQLWLTDGTSAGSKLVARLSGDFSSHGTDILIANDKYAILRVAEDNDQVSLWSLEAKTYKLRKLFSLHKNPKFWSHKVLHTANYVHFGNSDFAIGLTDEYDNRYVSILLTDGTIGGTRLLKNIGYNIWGFAGAEGLPYLTVASDDGWGVSVRAVYGSQRRSEPLLVSDEDTTGYSNMLPMRSGTFNGVAYFTVDEWSSNNGLWITDLTAKGTRQKAKFSQSGRSYEFYSSKSDLGLLLIGDGSRGDRLSIFRDLKKKPALSKDFQISTSYGVAVIGDAVVAGGNRDRLVAIDAATGAQTRLLGTRASFVNSITAVPLKNGQRCATTG
jgi:ELWxxDGT repeat protein